MEGSAIFGGGNYLNSAMETKLEEGEEEFRSCCEDENELKEMEASVKEGGAMDDLDDEFSVKMFFKGVSIARVKDSGSGLSGIGVVMDRAANVPAIQVQKKVEFYVEKIVAEYLALVDGLLEALQNKIQRVFAFTDSEVLYDQIIHEGRLDNPLLLALRQRVLEHARNLESFVLKLVDKVDLERPLHLAHVAIGIVYPAKDEESVETCSICCEEKPVQMMFTIKCSHKFCSLCMKTYVDGKIQSAQIPIRCPHLRCKYYISTTECWSFLTVGSFESLKRALAEANVLDSAEFYCPYRNCSVLLGPHNSLLTRVISSGDSDDSYVECQGCGRFICVACRLPWHSSMSCEECQNLPMEERDADNINSHSLAQNRMWRGCQQCQQMIQLNHGCYHVTCWRCGHEFCSCGGGYGNGQQTCQGALWDDQISDGITNTSLEYEQWAWDSFDPLPMIMDAYTDQERSQLALIQRFLAGGFTLSDHQPYESPPRCTDSYVDPMKDLHQLPWLARFVSVITDNYCEEYMQ